MKKLIFLDIDGPMIPQRAFLFHTHASIDQRLDPMCVEVLKKIIFATEAQIVFNSTHNRHLYPDDIVGDGLLKKFRDQGFFVGVEIHPEICTDYPGLDRLTAIRKFLRQHEPECSWVALDDCPLDDERACLVDECHGIGWNEYQHCMHFLLKPTLEALEEEF